LPKAYSTIPDVESIIFPINRISNGNAATENYFDLVRKMVSDCRKLFFVKEK
jgi:hypothetical protein